MGVHVKTLYKHMDVPAVRQGMYCNAPVIDERLAIELLTTTTTSIKKIARRLGVTPRTLKKRIDVRRHRPMVQSLPKPFDRDKAHAMLSDSSMTIATICEELGISPPTLYLRMDVGAYTRRKSRRTAGPPRRR